MISIFFGLLFWVITFYAWVIIGMAIYSLLSSFGVLDTRNHAVWTIGQVLTRATEPVLRPVRQLVRRLVDLGGIDISPLIVLVLIWQVLLPLIALFHRIALTGAWYLLFQ